MSFRKIKKKEERGTEGRRGGRREGKRKEDQENSTCKAFLKKKICVITESSQAKEIKIRH